VADVEGDRWQAVGALIEFGVGEGGTPLGDVFVGQLERVEHGADDGVAFSVGSAEPRFLCITHGYSPFPARKARTTAVTSWC
jgi:hypothetical protein